jgi:GNAT superfamily N-acetyltransferase
VINAGTLGVWFGGDDLDTKAMAAVLDTTVCRCGAGDAGGVAAAASFVQRDHRRCGVGVGLLRYLVDEAHGEHPINAVRYPAATASVIVLTVQYAENLSARR